MTNYSPNSLKRSITLLFIRIALIVLFQLFFVLILSWDEAIPWWPFSMIATEAVCLIILIVLLKKENKTFSSIQLAPFETLLPLGRISKYLNRKHTKNLFNNTIIDTVLFVFLIFVLGLPAIGLNELIQENIDILNDTRTIGALPKGALYIMIVLLPISQAFIEFPWYYGYIYPRIENYFVIKGKSSRIISSIKALSIVLVFFVLQLSLIPLIFNVSYIIWSMLSFVPILFVIAFVIRLAPRYMLGVNILHALMAIKVVVEFWKLK